jgi:flagellar motor switch protein FliG
MVAHASSSTALAANNRKLTGRQKAAALLIALGPELSAKILKHFKEEEVESLTVEVFAMEKVSEEIKAQVISELHSMALAKNYITSGGLDYARDMLVKALGQERAEEILGRLLAQRPQHPFEFLRKSDPAQLITFIQDEHPQTIALVMAHMPPKQAATLLTNLDPELQAEVATRIANMDRTSPEIVRRVEEVLRKKVSLVLTQDFSTVGGAEFLAGVLSGVDRATEKRIMENLEENYPEVAGEVRKLMFTFDDVIHLDDRSVQRVLRQVDSKDLSLALKGASEELKNHIFKNMSSRAAEMLRDEIKLSGPVRLRNVEEAQQRIVAIIRQLDEAEEIVISRGSEELLI